MDGATPSTPVGTGKATAAAAATLVVRHANYGAPISAPTSGNFPAIGSSLGPYFSVGRLGKGTFCSIHKCINLHYNHRNNNKTKKNNKRSNRWSKDKTNNKALRLVAAKVEIGEFKNSGVLGGEASILHFLDDVLPSHTVPTYMGHYASTDRDNNNNNVTSAIVMEYLTGQDMHVIRDWSTRHQHKLQHQQQQEEQRRQQKLQQKQHEQQQHDPQFSPQPYSNDCNSNNDNRIAVASNVNPASSSSSSSSSNGSTARPRRRVAVKDAVYLTAHVMLPLLRKMHSVGIIHRDVKPSNVVKRSDCSNNLFCMVDFGLSKSIVVPHNSDLANSKQSWKGSNWMRSSPGSAGFRFELLSPDNSNSNSNSVDSKTPDTENNTNPSTPNNDAAPRACYRKERTTADFRGTSMYASVRVHQLNDYCPRDDIWSLLYVFCDLAAGGLPWMSHAANRDRAACKTLKERIHGLEAQADGEILVDTRRLLLGDEYHVALFKKRKGNVDPPMDHEQDALVDDDDDPNLPRPLALSEDELKVGLLTKAFEHLKGLGYADIPDYDLIQTSLEGFLEKGADATISDDCNTAEDRGSPIPPIDWKLLSDSFKSNDSKKRIIKNNSIRNDDFGLKENSSVPTWELIDDDKDPLESSIFSEAESSVIGGKNAEEENGAPLYGEAADMARLPMELRFRVAQMEYNTLHNTTIEPHLALGDWLRVSLPLLYNPWNSKQYEKGGHRSNKDGYRREFFLKLVDKCLDCAAKFRGFREMKVIYGDDDDDATTDTTSSSKINGVTQRPTKRRRRVHVNNMHEPRSGEKSSNNKALTDLLAISKVMFELRMMKKAEEKLSRAPPPRLSFG